MSETPPKREPIMQFFEFAHLPEKLQVVSKPFGELAQRLEETVPRNAERSVALRKLLEAKDAAVRALIATAVMFLMLFPAFAFAQTVLPGPVVESQLAHTFWAYIFPALLTVGIPLIAALLAKGYAYLTELGKTKKWAAVLADFVLVVEHTVEHSEATIKPTLVTDFANGGSLTPAQGAELKQQTIDLLLSTAKPELIAAVKARVGDGFFSTFVSGAVEKAVAKIGEPAATP